MLNGPSDYSFTLDSADRDGQAVTDQAILVHFTYFLGGNQGPRNSETYLWQDQHEYLDSSSVFSPLLTLSG